MKIELDKINKLLENRTRLGILSVLVVNESSSFGDLKELLSLSDGNLATHIKMLEQAHYITSSKQFIGRKPNTTFRITSTGRDAFESHIDALEAFLKSINN